MVSRNSLFALDRLANLAIGLCGFRCHLQQIALTRLALFGRGHRKLVLGSGLQRQPDPAPLQSAGPNEVSFLGNKRYASALDQTLAGAVIVHPAMAARCQRARWLSKQLNPMLLGHVWPHCSIPCRRFLQAFTRPQSWRKGRSSTRRQRSGRCR